MYPYSDDDHSLDISCQILLHIVSLQVPICLAALASSSSLNLEESFPSDGFIERRGCLLNDRKQRKPVSASANAIIVTCKADAISKGNVNTSLNLPEQGVVHPVIVLFDKRASPMKHSVPDSIPKSFLPDRLAIL